jgi:hypothetical protein
MSCYFRHIKDLFEEAGVEVTKQNRPVLRARVAQLVGDPDGDCASTWKLVKEWKADPKRRKRLVRALRSCREAAPETEVPRRGLPAVREAVEVKTAEVRQGASGALQGIFDWATAIQPDSARAAVQKLRARRPRATPRQLAETVVRRTRLQTGAVGVGTGLPSNPWLAGGAGLVDAGVALRLHVMMVAQIGEIYDPGFLDDPEAQGEVLVPLFGIAAASKAVKKGAVLGGMGATRQGVRRILTGSRLRAFRNWVLKCFGQTVGQKVVVTKMLPVIGALIGGGWNFAETSLVGKRAIRYFEGEPLGE